MTIKEMVAIARDHWKVVNPKVYRKMVRRGEEILESEAAAKLTQMEIDTLKLGGMSQQEAWQTSRELFFLIDPAKIYNP